MSKDASSSLPRAVLWDLDGTLADSREYHWQSWLDALEPEGVRITKADFLASFGQRNDTILPVWLGADVSPERIQRVGNAKEEAYRRIVAEKGLEPLPGAAEWVRALHEAGWRQAIASSAPRLNVEVMHRALRFEGLIDTLVAAEDVHRGKPDPEVFLTAAARLGVAPERCVVVEDAAAGIEAAHRGGMRSIGVGTGDVDAADVVSRSLADLVEDTFDALLETGLDT
jgi:beta-phosphoglucomutase